MCMCMCAAVVYISELITYYLSSTNVHFVVCYFSSVMFMLVHVLESKCNIFSFHCDILHNTLNTKIIYDYKVDCLRLKGNLVELYIEEVNHFNAVALGKHCQLLFCSLAVLDPRVGHTIDVLSPFISVLRHSN